MAIVRSTLKAGDELTPEEREAARLRIKAAACRPYTPDPDCPLLTDAQLSEFRPINGMSWEERDRLLKGQEQAAELAHAE
ncbi:hypothetical protein FACS189493_8090 [Spirochaetia bacterium]|nr:hypothetical protein FACS189493_8090 [Spirochaetia bacterium]